MAELKFIEGANDEYAVDIDGNIHSFKHGRHKLMSVNVGKRGYKFCTLRMGGKYKTVTVHRLLAIAFIPNPDDLPQVNHKDGDKLNNAIDNLEWVTAKQNTQHAISAGLHDVSGSNGANRWAKSLFTIEEVDELFEMRDALKLSVSKMSRLAGVHYNTMYRILNGGVKCFKGGGYVTNYC